MHWRKVELDNHKDHIQWLDDARAKKTYTLAGLFDSKRHLGLNSETVGNIERLEFGDDSSGATEWLKLRIPISDRLVVVFGEDECFGCSAEFFLQNWRDLILPSRDDAIIFSDNSSLVAFYCHENEFELGERLIYKPV